MKKIFFYKDKILSPLVQRIPAAVSPNHLSFARLVLTMPIALLLLQGYVMAALGVFVVGAITDFLDGPLARLRKQHSPSGELLDALADKIFFSTPFLILGITLLPAILYIGILTTELSILLGSLVAGSAIWLFQRRHLRIKAHQTGQVKMAFYFIATVILLMPYVSPALYTIALALYSAGFFLAVASIVEFLVKLSKEL